MTISKNSVQKYWILIAMSMALAVLFLDQTAVTIALPIMQNHLNATNVELQWIVNSYLLATACLLMLGGKLGDAFGQKTVFLIGMAIFIFGSCCTALAHHIDTVIIHRTVQGIGAALMIPASSVIVYNSFSPQTRGRAMGTQLAIASLFLTLGPVIGALLTHYLSWRAIFWLNLPTGLFCGLVIYWAVPSHVAQKIKKTGSKLIKLDWLGFGLSLLMILCLTIGLMQATVWGWLDLRTLLLLGATIIFALWFYYQETKHQQPFINLGLLYDRSFLVSCLFLLLIQTNFVARVFIVLYVQNVLGYSIMTAALLILPTTLPILFAGPIGGYLLDRYGPKIPIIIGLLVIGLSSVYMAGFVWLFNFWFIFPALLLFSFGAPLVVSTARVAALMSIDQDQRGAATGLSNTARQIGGTIGLALITALIYGLNKLHLNQYLRHGPPALQQLDASDLSGLLSNTNSANQYLAHVVDPNTLGQLHTAAAHAYTFGFSCAILLVGLISLAGIWLANYLPKKD